MSNSMTDTARSTQTWVSVFVAEFRRIVLRPRTLVALALFATAAVLVTVGLVTTIDWAAQEVMEGGGPVEGPFPGLGLSVSVLSFTLSLLCVSSSSRDYGDGAAAATLLVVPKRGRILSVRIVVWMVASACVTLVSLLVLTLMYASRIGELGYTLAGVACSTLGVCMLVLVAFACATLLRRGALAMLTFLGIDLLLPMGIPLVGNFLPEGAAYFVETLTKVLPGEVCSAVGDVTESAMGNGSWAFAMVALVAWAVVAVVVSHFSFNRYVGASD